MATNMVQAWAGFPMDQPGGAGGGFAYNYSLFWFYSLVPVTFLADLQDFADGFSNWLTLASLSCNPYMPVGGPQGIVKCYTLDNPSLYVTGSWGIFTSTPDECLPSRSCVVFNRFSAEMPPWTRGRLFWPSPIKAWVQGNILIAGNYPILADSLSQPFITTYNTFTPAIPSYKGSNLLTIHHYTISPRLGQYRKKLWDKQQGSVINQGIKFL